MLAAFTLILVCQIAGEALVRGAGLPLPGPVIGMLLLFLLMRLRLPLPPELNDAADVLLKYLALLFVPAGVGAVQRVPPGVFWTQDTAMRPRLLGRVRPTIRAWSEQGCGRHSSPAASARYSAQRRPGPQREPPRQCGKSGPTRPAL